MGDVVQLVKLAQTVSKLGSIADTIESALNVAKVVAFTSTASASLDTLGGIAKFVKNGQLDTAALAKNGFEVKDGVIASVSEKVNSKAIAEAMKAQVMSAPVVTGADMDIDAALASFQTSSATTALPTKQAAAAEKEGVND
jgi:hypothetical protein